MKRLFLALIFLVAFQFIMIDITFALPNPAAVYCKELGYDYRIVKTSQGEYGVCIFPDKSKCDEWEFFKGKCKKEYSYCIKNGYNIRTASDGNNYYSNEYAVCVPKTTSQKEIPASNFITLNENLVTSATPKGSINTIMSTTSTTPKISITSLPFSFDWRNKDGQNWMTPVKDQGSCGACWDFAAVGTVEAKIKIEKNIPSINPDLSEQDVLSCDGARDCSGGVAVIAFDYIKNTGIVDELCFPYTARTDPCSNRCSDWKNRLTKIADYESIPLSSDIKSYLIEKGPLKANIAMEGSFDSIGIYKCDGSPQINHEIIVVGYNDSYGYWIAKNSWGGGWNGDGYFKIYYGSCSISFIDYVYATGQKNGICNKDVGASPNCDGKFPSSIWCDGPVKKNCDSVCQYSEFCDSTCGSTPDCNGRPPDATWCFGNTQKGCDSSCQYSEMNCTIRLEDTDGGKNPLIKGACYDYRGCIGWRCLNYYHTDFCTDSIHLTEYYIGNDPWIDRTTCLVNIMTCNSSYICSDGKCINPTTTTIRRSLSGGGGGGVRIRMMDLINIIREIIAKILGVNK